MSKHADRFHDETNMSGWISLEKFKKIFSGVSVDEFTRDIDHPILFGDGVSNIETSNHKGVVSFRINENRSSKGRAPLNYLFPFVHRGKDIASEGFVIGSSSKSNFILPDYTVSQTHAVFYKKGRSYFLKDLGSELGSFVNNAPFGTKEVLLSDGDSISIGRYQFLFLEPRTLYDHVFRFQDSEAEEETLTEEISERINTRNNTLRKDLKKDLDSSFHHVKECIINGLFPGFDERLLTILSFIPFFHPFSVNEKKQIISFHNKFVSANRGDMIINENENSNEFYIILKGRVEVIKSDSSIPLNSLGPSSSFGEIAFLTGSPRYASVVAKEETILFRIDHEFFKNIGVEIRDKLKGQIIRQISAITHRQNIYLQECEKGNDDVTKVYGKTGTDPVKLGRDEATLLIARYMAGSSRFQTFTEYEKNSLVVSVDSVKKYNNGDAVLKEGFLNDGVYHILEGSVYVTGAESGIVLSELDRGQFFGEMSAFGRNLVAANIISKGKSTIMMISVENFQSMSIETREKLKDLILRQIIDRQSEQNLQQLKYSV
ncbi:MAG: cyclic nucleotide-binding domain-containing protein [Magnetococcales bacterium]|nr:cyclic nucleotide-binding domain-containing protein [Magnetococcales bacterium]